MQVEQAVEGFLSGYFSTCKRSAKTLAAYRIDLSQFQRRFGSHQFLKTLKADHLEHWATELRNTGYAPVSIRRKFATARVFFSYWVRKGVLEVSPLWKIRLDLGRQRVLPRSVSASDAKRMIEGMWGHVPCFAPALPSARDPRFLAFRDLVALEILFATGMRVGELASLRCADWLQDDDAFLVRGKGLRERLAFLPDERSKQALNMYMRHRSAMDLGHDGLLVNASGRQISTQGIARIITSAAKRSQLGNRVTPHMIRHTVATLLLRCGADIRVVQEVLGHASITTTQRYTYVSKEHLRSTLQATHPNYHLSVEVRHAPGAQLNLPFAPLSHAD